MCRWGGRNIFQAKGVVYGKAPRQKQEGLFRNFQVVQYDCGLGGTEGGLGVQASKAGSGCTKKAFAIYPTSSIILEVSLVIGKHQFMS